MVWYVGLVCGRDARRSLIVIRIGGPRNEPVRIEQGTGSPLQMGTTRLGAVPINGTECGTFIRVAQIYFGWRTSQFRRFPQVWMLLGDGMAGEHCAVLPGLDVMRCRAIFSRFQTAWKAVII
jgi:hypothetical protein